MISNTKFTTYLDGLEISKKKKNSNFINEKVGIRSSQDHQVATLKSF